MKPAKKTWRDIIYDVLDGLPPVFSLAEVVAQKDKLAKEYPQNRYIEAKIRQTLQVLRDQGVLQFLGSGKYRRVDVAPTISLHFDATLAAGFTSKAQSARVMIETWAELNLYCLGCSSDRLRRLPANTPLADFACPGCEKEYQLKAKDGRFGDLVAGAAYAPLIAAARSGMLPDYILAEYDTRWALINSVRAIPGHQIDATRIDARKALSEGARRAGWIGAVINVADLGSVELVAPKPEDRKLVRSAWKTVAVPVRGAEKARALLVG
jgi:hypothetical protein